MFFDVIGWVGMICVLLAYALLSTNKIKNGRLYQGLNLVAGIFMAIGLLQKKCVGFFYFANNMGFSCAYCNYQNERIINL